MKDDREYWLAFSVCPGIGPKKFELLLKNFGSAEKAWSATSKDLEGIIGQAETAKLNRFKSQFSIKNYVRLLRRNKANFITLTEPEYPKLLAQIHRPPFVLYIKGNTDLNAPCFAVVGTRRITNYGREVTEILTTELSYGFTIVSGMALGVDAEAHRSTIEAGGKTIAVLGCGVDCPTPLENEALYNGILKNGGAIVSELPLSHPPTIGSFPSRNRIIAGLSQGVLVTEGAEDSGSLITADYALKFKRPVFAVPGPITSSLSKGPFKLLSKGAKLVTSAEDIFNELKVSSSKIKTKDHKGNSKYEILILGIIENEPLHFDEIARKSKINSSKLGSILSLMEVKGLVKSLSGGYFSS